MTESEFISQFSSDGVWYGDRCGCSDDRCIGFHHDETDRCGCFPTMLEQAIDGLDLQAQAWAERSKALAAAEAQAAAQAAATAEATTDATTEATATAEAAPMDAATEAAPVDAAMVKAVAELGEAGP